jgi:hypothetical protein
MTWALAPFTAALAEALNVRSVLFATNEPKDAIETVVLHIDIPPQRVTILRAPDLTEGGITFEAVQVLDRLRAKVKRDRDPRVMDATLKLSVGYPEAAQLLALAHAVTETHYLTFTPEQGELFDGQEAAPPRRGRREELRH